MRIKRGLTKTKRHKKILKGTKGYLLSYSKLYKRAKEATLHAGQYSYAHRRKRAGQQRRVWITRLNAALSKFNLKYNKFINLLKENGIDLNRKILSEIALNNEQAFAEIVKAVNNK